MHAQHPRMQVKMYALHYTPRIQSDGASRSCLANFDLRRLRKGRPLSAHLPDLMPRAGGWFDGDVDADFNPESGRVAKAVTEAGIGCFEFDITKKEARDQPLLDAVSFASHPAYPRVANTLARR